MRGKVDEGSHSDVGRGVSCCIAVMIFSSAHMYDRQESLLGKSIAMAHWGQIAYESEFWGKGLFFGMMVARDVGVW